MGGVWLERPTPHIPSQTTGSATVCVPTSQPHPHPTLVICIFELFDPSLLCLMLMFCGILKMTDPDVSVLVEMGRWLKIRMRELHVGNRINNLLKVFGELANIQVSSF